MIPDWEDVLTVVGVVCLAVAMWLSLGWPGLLGFVGAVLIVVGVVAARQERGVNGQQPKRVG